MNFKKIKSYAKINLSLGVTGKNSKYHKIETLVSFIKYHDLIYLKKTRLNKHKISFYGNFSKRIQLKDNSIINLLKLLDKKNLLGKNKFEIKIKKNIPQKSGLGGGSMNAVSILNFFIKKKFLKIKKKLIYLIAEEIGSDVPLGLKVCNTILFKNGKILKFPRSKQYYILIIKPNFGCSTKFIYSKVTKFTKSKLNFAKKRQQEKLFNIENLKNLDNDLETIAFKKYPSLKKIKILINNLTNPLLVRMTGSGSALVAYYYSKKASEKAKTIFRKQNRNYWCITSKTI